MKTKRTISTGIYSRIILFLGILFLGNFTFSQQLLYGIRNSDIITIDPATGTSTVLMTVNPSFGAIQRLTYHEANDLFYAYGNGSSTTLSSLLEINICTQQVTEIGTITIGGVGVAFASEGLDYDPNTQMLYATFGSVSGSAFSDNLYTIDPTTAVATLLGNIQHGNPPVQDEFDIIEFTNTNSATSTLIGWDFNAIDLSAFFSIDYTSSNAGDAPFLSDPPGLPIIRAFAFNEDDNILYGVVGTTLAQIDPATGVITPMLGAPIAAGIRGLEWGPTCCPYEIGTIEMSCEDLDCLCCGTPKICIPFNVINTIENGMIGIDFCVEYDAAFLTPTGNVTIGGVVTNGSPDADYAINYVMTPGVLHVSIFYEASAPAGVEFVGSGEIACVEFELSSTYTTGTTLDFSVCEVIEGFQTSVEFECANDGSFTLLDDTELEGKIIFWEDNARPLRYDAVNPMDYLVTEIAGTDAACLPTGNPLETTDLDGNFTYDITNGPSVQITRDIVGNTGSSAPCPSPSGVMPVINGMDAYWTSLVTTLNGSYVPSVYQIIAMDVNMDGFVSANDITHIQNRTIGNICEYPQAWNNPVIQNSLDWRFTDSTTVDTDPAYEVSNVYPSDDNTGYSRYNVPNVPFCLEVLTEDNGGFCTVIPNQTYNGILLGDANGSWDGNMTGVVIKANDVITYALDESTTDDNCVISIPVYYQSTSNLIAMDFNLDYDETRLTLIDVVTNTVASQMSMAYNDLNSEALLLTSYSSNPGGISFIEPAYYLQFKSIDDQISSADLGSISSYLNGNLTTSSIDGTLIDCATIGTASIDALNAVDTEILVSPNPFNDALSIELNEMGKVVLELTDVNGKVIISESFNNQTSISLDTRMVSPGIYILRLNGITSKKVVKH